MRTIALLVLVALAAVACSSGGDEGGSAAVAETAAEEPAQVLPNGEPESQFGSPPAVPDGELDPEAAEALADLIASFESTIDESAIVRLGASDDARVAWFLTDLQRFLPLDSPAAAETRTALRLLTGVDAEPVESYEDTIDHLIAWDIPAHPGYREAKGELFGLLEPGWAPFFADEEAELDYRLLQWGGVFIDARPLGAPDPVTGFSTAGEVASSPAELCPRGCIPALDDPVVTDAAGGDWLDDAAIVFGVVVGGESRAYPRHIMEVHEMVNDSLGGRRIGLPYCTLCGSAQTYLTDSFGDDTPVLRTSGLLSRSNKVMYDLNTGSVFDTFDGRALSGPLQGRELDQVSTVVTTWGEWKAAHPETTIVAEDGGIGRTYALDPLGGRDDAGPIFPIGDVDPRLPVQEPVLGVATADGRYVAFPVIAATLALEAGDEVSFEEIGLELDGGGLRAISDGDTELVGHQAFWFAWSQFHPETEVWTP